jgi:hypothetical protein
VDAKTAVALVKKHGTMTEAAKHAKTTRHVIARALRKVAKELDKGKKKPLSEFRALYDKSYIVPNKIKSALKELANGWEYEVEFAKTAGVTLSDLHAYREQFIDFVVQIEKNGRRAWAGSKSLATQMRKMV